MKSLFFRQLKTGILNLTPSLLFLSLNFLPLQAQIWQQIGSDIDGEASFDYSGKNISLNAAGNIIAIGAKGNDGNGTDAGHVRIFQWNGNNWTQIGNDIDGEDSTDYSGSAVCLNASGTRVAIGADGNDGNGINAGQVRIYQWNGSNWTQMGNDIDGEAAGDFSGGSLAINKTGDRVAIGATGNDGNGNEAGQVRIFQWNGSNWTQIGNDIDGEAAGDVSGFGLAMNANGNIVAIGATGNSGNGTAAGQARVFEWNGSNWIQKGSDIDGAATGDFFGNSVALSASGNTIAIGAPYNDGNGTDAGHVQAYQWNGNSWQQRGQDIYGSTTGDQANIVSMDDDGSTLAVGAPFHPGNGIASGHIRIFKWNGSNWQQRGNDITGEAAGDQTNAPSLSENGNILATGAPYNAGNGSFSGHVRIWGDTCTPQFSTDTINACDSIIWIDGNLYSANNNSATFSLPDASGCDSNITLNLSLKYSSFRTDSVTACNSYTWIDGNTYTSSNNTATYTLTNNVGCDSTIDLQLTLNTNSSSTDTIQSCSTYTWIDGVTYFSSNNTATVVLPNTSGCDSIIHLNLTINIPDTTLTDNSPTLLSNENNASYQWVDCNNNFTPIPGATSQSYTATTTGNYAVILNLNGCIDTSQCSYVTINTLHRENISPTPLITPNPAKNKITIDLGQPYHSLELTIRNAIGQPVAQIKRKTITQKLLIELTNITPGLYIIELKSIGKPTKILKFIRERD